MMRGKGTLSINWSFPNTPEWSLLLLLHIFLQMPQVVEIHKQTGQESMETLCEEIYHAMEDYIVTNMNWNLSVIDTQYFQELCDWKENFENYTSYDYDKYVSQPLEASAKKYCVSITDRFQFILVTI